MGWRKDLQWSISYHEKLKKKREAQRKIQEWYKRQRENPGAIYWQQRFMHEHFKMEVTKNVRVL
jgi:hypothetical protein